MSRVPALTRMVPRSPPSRTRRAACGGGLRPSLTAPTPDTHALSGRGEETAPISRTKKHHRQKPKQLLHSLTDATAAGHIAGDGGLAAERAMMAAKGLRHDSGVPSLTDRM